MDFHDSPQETAFRAEVRDFLRRELPQRGGIDPYAGFGGADFYLQFMDKLAARGWVAPAWPKEYGGAGLSVVQQFIFNQEMATARAPRPSPIAVGFAGPTLIVHGTEDQKQKYLSEILSGRVHWCQGYSEPGAGSDLASLQTRAVHDGDDYVVNGQKIWTSLGHLAKWMILLARTDPDAPKHRGISYFVLDMKSPGVTVRPLVNMAGTHEFNEVFFEDVRVPRENLIGEENRGWYLAQTTLSFERSNIGSAVGQQQIVEDLIRVAKDPSTAGMRMDGINHAVRTELVDRYVETEVATMMSYRIVTMQARGLIPSQEASAAKLFSTELNQRIYRTAMKVLGPYGQVLGRSPAHALLKGQVAYMYLRSVANTIEGGTSEIQRNIVATRGLGLPRN